MIARGVGRPRNPTLDNRFLAAAVLLIAEYGLHALNVNLLAGTLHAGKASFYRRWPSIDHFLADVVRYLAAHPVGDVTADAILRTSGRQVRALVEDQLLDDVRTLIGHSP